MDEINKKRLEKLEEEHDQKLIEERKVQDDILMRRLNRQLDLVKFRKLRDNSILQNEVYEEDDEEDEIYEVSQNEDGEIEVDKKED